MGSVTELSAMAVDGDLSTTKVSDHIASHSNNADAGMVMAMSMGTGNHTGIMNAIPETIKCLPMTILLIKLRVHDGMVPIPMVDETMVMGHVDDEASVHLGPVV